MNPLSAVIDIGTKLIDRLIPDPTKKAEALLKLKELEQSGDLAVIAAQTDINKVEAASTNWFVAGWRPFIGWICGSGLGIQFIVRPLFIWFSSLINHPTDFPALDMSTMIELLFGMLGVAGLRTYEKRTGSEANR